MACMSDTHGHHNTSFLSLENLTAVHETVVVTDIACLRWLHSRDSANLTVLQNRQRVSHYLDCLQDIVAAALAMQIAHEMDPLSQHHKHDMERLMRRIPQTVADVLEVQHACSLVCVRPKSHYLHAHMHTRMYAHTRTHNHCSMRNTMFKSLAAQLTLVIVTTVVSSAVLCTSMS